ncbi:MAG: ATP-binding protein [Cyanobacteria bacterium J06631_12]
MERIVLAARTGVNANVLRDVLEAEAQVQIEPPTIETVSSAIETEASLLVLTEEVLTEPEKAEELGDRISQQPDWSDLPIIILLSECQRFENCLALLGQTTHHRSVLLLERPLKRPIFTTVVRSCLQNRRRQYRLRDSMHQLRESNQALENFSYTAAHELRNPLGVAKNSFDLLARTSLDTRQQKLVDMGQRTTHKMNRLIGTLLDYSKSTSPAEEFVSVDMDSVMRETVEGLQVIIAKKQAEVTWSALTKVLGNRQLLVQLMSNLVKNAIVHNTSPVPKVAISALSAADVEAELVETELAEAGVADIAQVNIGSMNQSQTDLPQSEYNPSNRWVFFVADNGPGMTPEIQSKIFDMFSRAGKSRAEGNGIGLALCQRVAQQHGTTIRVKSQPGSGSTFYFELAAADGS